jgi:hypothetical protein
MKDRLSGSFFTLMGVLAVVTSLFGLVRGEVWFLGRGSAGATLIEKSATPGLYWFVVIFYLLGGGTVALYGIKMFRHNDLRVP